MKKITLKNPNPVITKDEVFTSRSQDPKVRVVESPGKDIVDYVIEEAKLDPDGNVVTKVKPPFYETTGRSLKWSIMTGETARFPEYVARYLMKIYPFLEEVDEDEVEDKKVESTENTGNSLSPVLTDEPTDAKGVDGPTSCNICGLPYKNARALALHKAHKHTEAVINAR